MRAGSRWKRTPFPASPVGGIAPLASGRQTRPRTDRDRANLGRRPGANKGLRRLWEISAGCLGREPYRSTGWPASRKPCSRPCGSEFTGSVGVSCCGFKARAQARCFPGAQRFLPPPPHGFRFARGTPPDPSYESPCAPHGDALDEESWSSRQRPSRRPNAVVAPGDERHGCRERRARPWMAHRAGPQTTLAANALQCGPKGERSE